MLRIAPLHTIAIDKDHAAWRVTVVDAQRARAHGRNWFQTFHLASLSQYTLLIVHISLRSMNTPNA